MSALIFIASLDYQQIKKAYEDSYRYEKLQNYEMAIKALMPVYKEYPKGYTVNLRLGWLYYLWGKYRNSIEHYQIAMEVAPYSVEARLGYMLPLLAQGRYAEVEKVAYQILKTDYYNYYANLRLAYALRMQKKYDLASEVARKMLVLYPTDVQFLVELALDYIGMGQKDKGYSILWDVLILQPDNETAKKVLGLK